MAQKEDTVQLEIRLSLPDSVAREAEASGLLEPESMESLLREALRKRRIDHLFEAADRLAAVPLSSLTEAEVEAEVQAVRTARRTHLRNLESFRGIRIVTAAELMNLNLLSYS